MDTETVFKIIDHINGKIAAIDADVLTNIETTTELGAAMTYAKRKTLKELEDYLQSYIDKQVSYAENELEGGY